MRAQKKSRVSLLVLGTAIVASALVVVVTPTAGAAPLSSDEVEQQVTKGLSRLFIFERVEVRAACPHKVPRRKGIKFTCSVRIGNQRAKIRVALTDRYADFDIRWYPIGVLLPTENIEMTLQSHFSNSLEDQVAVDVFCGEEPAFIAPVGEYQCEYLVDTGERGVVTFEVRAGGHLKAVVFTPSSG